MTSESTNNTISVVALVLAILALVLWFTGQFWEEVVQVANAPVPTAEPAPTPVPTPSPTPTPEPAAVKVAQAEYDKFLEGAYIDGNENAPITVIEFSDVECPFCQRHNSNWTLDQVNEKYGDDVNVIFAHFPLSFHANAQKAWEAIECAGKLWGKEKFFEFKDAYFGKGWNSSMELAQEAATDVGLDADKLMDCVDSGEFTQKVKDHMAFGQSLGVTWTPGNIVIDNETLETQKVSWAVPATAFDPAITSFLN